MCVTRIFVNGPPGGSRKWSDDQIVLIYQMMGKNRVVSATEFKAKCLSLLDEIEQNGAQITVTRRGTPVAVLGPAPREAWKSPANSWASRARIVGDIVNADTSGLWDVVVDK